MKLEILRENLERAVSVCARASNKNLSLPVLSCIIISASESKTELKATNLDLSIEASLKAKVMESGVIAVPAHILMQTVSALTDQKLVLKTEGNNLIIDGDRGKTAITLVDPSEFPTLPHVKKGGSGEVIIPTKVFTATLRSVAFSAASSGVKPEQASICLSLEHDELVAAATDSFRLAEMRVPIKTKGSFGTVLLPARNTADILRALDESEEVEIRVGENQVSFVSDFGIVTSRTVDGAFPDYRSVIPKGFVASATCLKEDAAQAFRKISIFMDSFNQVHLSLKPSENAFTVRALNASVGETLDKIPAALDGEDIDINFNARYIIEALSVVPGDSVVFSTAGQGRPMVMTDVPHRGFTYLVMPMNR